MHLAGSAASGRMSSPAACGNGRAGPLAGQDADVLLMDEPFARWTR